MAKRDEFIIEVTCTKCGSKQIEAELHMVQGSGLIGFECRQCPNNPNMLYDDEDLDDTINQHLPVDVRGLSRRQQYALDESSESEEEY